MSAFDDVLNQKAVALTYDEDNQAAPVIVASGMGYMARKIVETAKENGVPVYEDNSLATVLTQLDLGSEIPEELYAAIVDIYVYFLNYGEKRKRRAAMTQESAGGENPENAGDASAAGDAADAAEENQGVVG